MSVLNPESEKRLNSLLKEMAALQDKIDPLKERFKALEKEAYPLVQAAGDKYIVDKITATIQRPGTWKVNAIKLLERFGEKVHGVLTVSAPKFRDLFNTGALGRESDLQGIAKRVKKTPKFVLSRK